MTRIAGRFGGDLIHPPRAAEPAPSRSRDRRDDPSPAFFLGVRLEALAGNLVRVERLVAEQQIIRNYQSPRLACPHSLHFQGHLDPVRTGRVLFEGARSYNSLDPHDLLLAPPE